MLIETLEALPKNWDSGELPVQDMQWTILPQSMKTTERKFWTSNNISRFWANKDAEIATPRIQESIYQYASPVIAMLAFEIFKPEIYYRYHRPNFYGFCEKEVCYPSDGLPFETHADQEHLVCAMGVPSDCQEYFYWARYGQYLVMVRYFGPNMGMDLDVFSQVIHAADQQIRFVKQK